ncbi:MAG: bis-aminopropyl spermidine synthase family protein [Candidatus Pacebacteria bacterium]|nr:bis-aminopropyl spermidine synthase family protein [Candidatus Paceibacterota bacterium]
MKNFLRNLYKEFLVSDKSDFLLNATKFSTSLSGLHLSPKIIEDFFNNYKKIPFFIFLKRVKSLIYSKDVFGFISKTSSEDWELWPYLKFLKDKKIIDVKRNGQILLLKKELLNTIPRPQSEKEIEQKIEKKLKIKVSGKEPVINLFKKFQDFEVKAKWDQMPISQESAIFVAKKILENLPQNERFLFVGDDDFISVILGLADPNIESLVIDADDNLLDCINFLAKKFNLKIKTKKVDLRKQKYLGEKFVGFLVNPVYTEAGVKDFVKFGKNQLGEDGGVAFLEVGDESIGNRFLFLQEFFSKNNLIIKELILEKVYYPYIALYEEDKELMRRFSQMIDARIIKKSPRLAASLYVFDYLPSRPKKIKFKKPIYAYL